MQAGGGGPVLERVLKSEYRPSKKLLDHTAAMVAGQREYILLDEQLVVFNSVLAQAARSIEDGTRAVMLVRGGPGTGKSVIALHLVGQLAKRGYNAQHATGSKAFTENVRRVVGSRAGIQFRYFNSYGDAPPGGIDVLVCDEAHRIRTTSNSRFSRTKSTRAQIAELVGAAKVAVFLIDDLQVVRPGEVGSSDLIRGAAVDAKAAVREFDLEAQFRCAGSDAFVQWVDNTLGIRRTPNVLWDRRDAFDFRITESVEELDRLIADRAAAGASARLSAGFCWPWSDPRPDGSLVPDVAVGSWTRAWNAKPDAGRLAAGIPKSVYWASDPNGLAQVGCVYTAQGFEYDYAGVIFGRDLRYDPVTGAWIGDPTESHDTVVRRSREKFVEMVKNTYRVLLTRGMKGCYVYFMDAETRNFVRSRIE